MTKLLNLSSVIMFFSAVKCFDFKYLYLFFKKQKSIYANCPVILIH